MSWRRAPLALAAAAAAVLLLLHALAGRGALAPAPAARLLALPAPAPAAAALAALAPRVAAPAASLGNSSEAASLPSSSTGAAPPSPPAPPAPAAPAAPAGPKPVLTGALYVAGHSRAHPELCPALGARTKLLILVTSAPSHADARDAVRLTWGHYAARRDVTFAFVLGEPPAALKAALDAEDAMYGDLIQGNSIDSYSNLTLKTLSLLEWAATYCPRAPRLLKTDDDMFINVPRLLRFAASHPGERTVWGRVIRRSPPKRTPRSKYYVSPLQFPDKRYPDFATGPAYLLTTDIVPELLAAAPSQPYVRLEDVFVTGVLGSRLGLRRRHAAEFYNRHVAPHPCAVQRGVAVHMVRRHEQFDLWRKLLDGKTKCPDAR